VGQPVDQHAGLVASGESIDDLSIVGHGRPLRQAVDPRNVVQPAIDSAKLARVDEALQNLVHGVAVAEVKEIEGCPDLRWISTAGSIGDEFLQINHVRYLYTFFGPKNTVAQRQEQNWIDAHPAYSQNY